MEQAVELSLCRPGPRAVCLRALPLWLPLWLLILPALAASEDSVELRISSGRVDNPDAAYALKRAARWIGLISPESVFADADAETLARFAAGDAAFMRHWPYAWQTLQAPSSPVRGQVGVALLPKGGAEGQHAAVLGGWQLAVSRYSRYPEQATDLLRHLTSARVQRTRAQQYDYLPTRQELFSEPAVLASDACRPRADRARNRCSSWCGAWALVLRQISLTAP